MHTLECMEVTNKRDMVILSTKRKWMRFCTAMNVTNEVKKRVLENSMPPRNRCVCQEQERI
jgi:hypothetical protein